MLENVLALDLGHTTEHVRAYSGDLAQFVSHNNGSALCSPHDYIDAEKLRPFLVGEGAIGGEEYPFDGSTNGMKYWLFYPVLKEHRRILDEQIKKRKYFAYVPNGIPNHWDVDKCCLVTHAFIATPSKDMLSRTTYKPLSPEYFTSESVLNTYHVLKMKTGTFFYCNNRYKDGDSVVYGDYVHINAILTDLRNKLYGKSRDETMFYVSFRDFYYPQIILRSDSYDNHIWSQIHMLPILKKILDNSSVHDAVVIKRELAKIELPSSSDTTDRLSKLILDVRREAGQRIIDDMFTNHYEPAIERALRELENDEEVVRSLKFM